MGDFLEVAARGVLPAVVAVPLAMVAGRRWLPIALAVGWCVAYGLLKQWPPLPLALWRGSNDALQWLWWGIVGAGLLASLAGGTHRRSGVLELLGFVLLCGTIYCATINVSRRLSPVDGGLLGGGAVLLVGATWWLLDRAVEKAPTRWVLPFFCLCATADSVALLLAGSALQAQLAGALAAGLGVAAAIEWRNRSPLAAGVAFFLAFALGGLLLLGTCLTELPRPAAAALAMAPTALLVARARGLAARSRLGAAVVAGAAATMIGYALWAVAAV